MLRHLLSQLVEVHEHARVQVRYLFAQTRDPGGVHLHLHIVDEALGGGSGPVLAAAPGRIGGLACLPGPWRQEAAVVARRRGRRRRGSCGAPPQLARHFRRVIHDQRRRPGRLHATPPGRRGRPLRRGPGDGGGEGQGVAHEAAQGGGRAVEGEVVQAHVVPGHLFQNGLGLLGQLLHLLGDAARPVFGVLRRHLQPGDLQRVLLVPLLQHFHLFLQLLKLHELLGIPGFVAAL
mmetsp:Transcript_103759/g.300095  ORF Transcript_103759/g.300095 Transcript_103759/m.300095 type:complete len:234 (+) Transcript_103759:2076-2777(+)